MKNEKKTSTKEKARQAKRRRRTRINETKRVNRTIARREDYFIKENIKSYYTFTTQKYVNGILKKNI